MSKAHEWQQCPLDDTRNAGRSLCSKTRLWRLTTAALVVVACITTLLGPSYYRPRGTEPHARIAKVTTCYGEDKHILGAYAQAMQTQLEHSRRHGYPTFTVDREILGGVWTKPAALLHVILEQLRLPEEERVEWLLWFDADTIILNQDTPLELFLPPPEYDGVQLMYSNDWNGLNSGVFYIRVSTWSVLYLSSVLAYNVYRPEEVLMYAEQTALENVMRFEQFQPNVVECPPQWFNAYPHNTDLGHVENWATAASLLIHFAGEGDREEKMSKWLTALESEPYKSGAHARAYGPEVAEFWQDYGSSHAVFAT